MTSDLEIPDSAFRVKADYFERPSRELVALIKKYIAQFGTPHLWWGHTHTTPQKGCRVTFLAKYSLPKSHHAPDRWAPCPCCWLKRPKYFRTGLIAWFPDEGVIRCVGDQCYKKMDPEGYELAIKKLNSEIEAEKRADFLLTRIPRIPEYIRALHANLPAVEAIDSMLNQVRYALGVRFDIDLWPEVQTGVLRYVVERTEMRRGRDGEQYPHTFSDFENYGAIAGRIALRSGSSRMAKRLKDRMDNLELINFGPDPMTRIASMTEADKERAVKILTYGHNKARDICAEAEECRRFFRHDTIATINGWSQKSGSTRVHFALDDEGFHIARDAEEHHTLVRWPPNFWNNIQQLEPLSRREAA